VNTLADLHLIPIKSIKPRGDHDLHVRVRYPEVSVILEAPEQDEPSISFDDGLVYILTSATVLLKPRLNSLYQFKAQARGLSFESQPHPDPKYLLHGRFPSKQDHGFFNQTVLSIIEQFTHQLPRAHTKFECEQLKPEGFETKFQIFTQIKDSIRMSRYFKFQGKTYPMPKSARQTKLFQALYDGARLLKPLNPGTINSSPKKDSRGVEDLLGH
jgi:hypothetical protein